MTKTFDVKTVGANVTARAPTYVRNSTSAAYEISKNLTAGDGDTRDSGEIGSIDWIRILLFGLWLAVVGALAWRHVIWRDEARALSFAIQGEDWIAMLRGLHGDGHPALWYFLLRSVHGITGRPEALGLVAFAVAAAAAWLIVWRSPFPRPLIGLILASHFFIYEFAVMARNYGIGMLILFVLAIAYPKCRGRGVALGALLFLLANCNVIATILAGAFLIFWFVEILEETGPRWSPAMTHFALNAAIAAAGAALCFATVYPTFNDAAVAAHPAGVGAATSSARSPIPRRPSNTCSGARSRRPILSSPGLPFWSPWAARC
jgi:hypothetical protein